ncbi:hypothetical protein KCU77_g19216, partial [Aureobasidium melanogenum]
MVATRAMAAKKAPNPDDKENDHHLALRKKPVRRATAKATTTATKSSAATTATKDPSSTALEKPSATAAPKKAPATRPKRQTRAAAAPSPDPAPQRVPATRRKPALPDVARGKVLRSRKVESEPEPEPEPEAERVEDQQAEEDDRVVSPPTIKVKAARTKKSTSIPEPESEHESEAESEPATEPELAPAAHKEEDVENEPKEPEQDAQEAAEEEEEDGSSEDEICGPKTPMRRTTRSQAAPRTATASTTARKLQTPARRFLSHRTNQGTPQTQRLPHNETRISSPPRPMTVARGAEKSMVFRPLKQQDAQHTPMPETA